MFPLTSWIDTGVTSWIVTLALEFFARLALVRSCMQWTGWFCLNKVLVEKPMSISLQYCPHKRTTELCGLSRHALFCDRKNAFEFVTTEPGNWRNLFVWVSLPWYNTTHWVPLCWFIINNTHFSNTKYMIMEKHFNYAIRLFGIRHNPQ